MSYKDKDKEKEYQRKWYLLHKEEKKEYDKKYRLENKDESKKYRLEHKDKKKEYNKEYRLEHKDKKNEQGRKWRKIQYDNDPIYKRLILIKRRFEYIILKIITNGNITERNDSNCLKLFGTTVNGFKKHIESQFTGTMSWYNYGRMDNEKPSGKKRKRRNRLARDPIYRGVRWRRGKIGIIFMIIKNGGITSKKFDKACLKVFGTTVDGYKKYIESQFTDTMSWDNHGSMDNPDAWQLDHIIRIGSFDFTIKENFTKAFHYTNTRPLMSSDHMEKTSNEKQSNSIQNIPIIE